jgi:ABC-2 type transport system ATP-binding protein
MLVFASHSDEFLVELCDTAVWMDGGVIREQGPLREVVSHYKGRDVFENLSPEILRRLEGAEARATG